MDFVAGLAALSLKNPPEEELATYLGQTGFLQVLNKYVARVVDERPEDPGHSLATWLAQDYGIAPVSMTADLAAAAAAESVVLPTEEATKVLADGTKIEADTDAAEQLSPAQLTALLQQGLRPALHLSCGLGAADLNTLNVSIAVNHAALNGWVKQPAPCCAASSLAGAWNAAHGLSRPQPYPEASRIFPTAADPSEEERVSVWQGVWQPRAYGNEVVPALFHKDTLQAMGDVLRAKIKSSAVTIMHALGCLRVDRPASPQTELERQIHASISAADLDTFGAMVRFARCLCAIPSCADGACTRYRASGDVLLFSMSMCCIRLPLWRTQWNFFRSIFKHMSVFQMVPAARPKRSPSEWPFQ